MNRNAVTQSVLSVCLVFAVVWIGAHSAGCAKVEDIKDTLERLKANSTPPKLVVTGPSMGVPGEPLVYDFSQSTGTFPLYTFEVTPKLEGKTQYSVNMLTKQVTFYGYQGTYRYAIRAANMAGEDRWQLDITIPGNPPPGPPAPPCPTCPKPAPCPQPTPIPQPSPQPQPEPVTPTPTPEPVKPNPPPTPVPSPEPPAGRFNVAPEVYRLAKTINDPTTAAKLATACRTLADGSFENLNAMATKVVATLASLPPAWTPLTSKVKASIAALYTEGKLQNRDDAAELLREVAGALEAAGK